MNRAARRNPNLAGGDRSDAILARGSIGPAIATWVWLAGCGLASSLVCNALFRQYSICVCGRCDLDDMVGGDQ